MNSLADKKILIVVLEGQKSKLETGINKASQQYKLGLWGVLIGIFLIPIYGIGVVPLIAGGLVALINANKRAKYRDELENLDAKISKLNSSMA
ncbi:MAG: hypothetical protein M1485_06565 [Chloroflexi bacterium]|nr:hypothetical protein [Chloroflexota bacterium]MCL5612199.1 hypothetical protein [Chloroflexota bacterium]